MEKGIEREKKLAKSDYFNESYFADAQLYSFVEQLQGIRSILKKFDTSKEIKILEIGKGNGFISTFIKKMGYNIVTFDINANLEPDVVGDVTQLSNYFESNIFDLIICCEVLEHMEFNNFETVLKEFRKVGSRYCFLTLPEYKSFSGFFALVRIFNKKKKISFTFTSKPKHKLPKEHFWEIDSENHSKRENLIGIISNYYNILDSSRFKLNPYHNYFILQR